MAFFGNDTGPLPPWKLWYFFFKAGTHSMKWTRAERSGFIERDGRLYAIVKSHLEIIELAFFYCQHFSTSPILLE